MKGLKAASAIALLSFMVISQKASAQTLSDIDIKPQLKPQIEKFQVESTPNQNSRDDNQKLQIYFEKGLELVKAQKWNEAIQVFDEIIKIQQNNQYAYFFRGFSYFQLENYQQAKSDLDKSIQLDYSISYAHFFRGVTNYALGNAQGAITDLQTAAKLFDKQGKAQMAQKSRDVIQRIRNA